MVVSIVLCSAVVAAAPMNAAVLKEEEGWCFWVARSDRVILRYHSKPCDCSTALPVALRTTPTRRPFHSTSCCLPSAVRPWWHPHPSRIRIAWTSYTVQPVHALHWFDCVNSFRLARRSQNSSKILHQMSSCGQSCRPTPSFSNRKIFKLEPPSRTTYRTGQIHGRSLPSSRVRSRFCRRSRRLYQP
jgi:hypothetical protein